MATKGKKVEIYYTSQGTTTGIDASALIFDGKNLEILTHGKVFKGTDTTYSADSASGLSLSGTQFSLNVGTKDSTNASSAAAFTSGRFYQVVPDKNNNLGVVVPWEDHNDDTWLPLTSSQAGYAPKASDGIDSIDTNTYYFLGYTGSSVNWFKLPENAFKNTTYSLYNLAFQNTAGDTVDTYKPAISPNKTFKAGSANVLISAASNVISIDTKDTTYTDFVKSGSGAAAGLVPKPSTTAGTTKFLREDGTWSVPSYTIIPDNNVTGSGTSGYIAKFSGANTITNGPAFGAGTTTFLRNDGSWVKPDNTWTAADVNNAGYVPKSVKGYFLHANASTGALEWVANPDTNTWRTIKGNGTSITSDSALNIKPGNGISISVSGGDITITNSKPDQDHNTDAKVDQTDSNTDQNSPVLVKNGTGTSAVNSGVIFADGVTINPKTNSLSISGSLSVTGTASFGNNVTASGGISMGSADLSFKGSDPGDIVWYNSTGSETERIWSQSGGGSLNYRTNAGSTYSLIHSGNYSSYALPLSGGTLTGGITINSNRGGYLGSDGVGIYIQTGSHWLRCGDGGCDYDGQGIIHAGNISSQSVNYANSADTCNYANRFMSHGTSNWDANSLTYPLAENYGQSGGSSNYPGGYGSVFQILASSDNGSLGGQFYWSINHNSTSSTGNLYFRAGNNLGWQNDWKRIAWASEIPSTISWSNVTDKPSTYAPSSHSHDYLPLSGGTMSGNISFSNSGTGFRGINYGTMGNNDQWRIGGAATGSNSGYMEIATADDGTEPIYVRQYTGVFSSLVRTATLLDYKGDTTFPGSVYSNSDRHLKKDISRIDKDSLGQLFDISDKLLKQFTWKQTGKASYGLIAQQLEKYIPEAVSKDETSGTKSVAYEVAYAKIIAALVSEIKDLKTKVDHLSALNI